VTCRRAVTHSDGSGNILVTDILLEKRVYVRGIGDSVWSLLCEKYSSHDRELHPERERKLVNRSRHVETRVTGGMNVDSDQG
jgi:hypothetical protein